MNSDSRNYVVIPLQDDGTTSVNKRGPGWNEGGVAYTLNTVDHISVAYGFQKSINGIDAEEEKQPPLQADTHTKAYTLKIRGGCETYQTWSGKTAKAGKGPLIQIEKSATIAVSQDQILFQPEKRRID